jgi:hypothetical protein
MVLLGWWVMEPIRLQVSFVEEGTGRGGTGGLFFKKTERQLVLTQG